MLTDIYVIDVGGTNKVRRVGENTHDSLTVDETGLLRYYNLQNGDGGTMFSGGYRILQSEHGQLENEFGIIDERYKKEIREYLTEKYITRLDELKRELKAIDGMPCLSFSCREKCKEYLEHEIECIEKYGSKNPVMEYEPWS